MLAWILALDCFGDDRRRSLGEVKRFLKTVSEVSVPYSTSITVVSLPENLGFPRVCLPVLNFLGGLEHVPSSSSIHEDSVMERILLDAQHESACTSSHNGGSACTSTPQSPLFFNCEPDWGEGGKTGQMKESGPGRGSDFDTGIGCNSDWSSRLELSPPKQNVASGKSEMTECEKTSGPSEQGSEQTEERTDRRGGNTVTNMELCKRPGVLDARKDNAVCHGVFSSDMLALLVPTLFLSHLLTLGLGLIFTDLLSFIQVDAMLGTFLSSLWPAFIWGNDWEPHLRVHCDDHSSETPHSTPTSKWHQTVTE